jgi:hypothetical protein
LSGTLIDELRLMQARIEIGAKLNGVTDVTVMPYRSPSCLHEITQTVDATRRMDCRKCSVLRSCESIFASSFAAPKIADCLQYVNAFFFWRFPVDDIAGWSRRLSPDSRMTGRRPAEGGARRVAMDLGCHTRIVRF